MNEVLLVLRGSGQPRGPAERTRPTELKSASTIDRGAQSAVGIRRGRASADGPRPKGEDGEIGIAGANSGDETHRDLREMCVGGPKKNVPLTV